MLSLPDRFIGIDSGIRGGGGVVVLELCKEPEFNFKVLASEHIQRRDGDSEIDMIVRTSNTVIRWYHSYNPRVIAREDHNFLGMPERMSRNILRRINGALDYNVTQACGFVSGTQYLAFPPGSWKAIAGIPGDIGKTVRKQEGRGERFKKRKKASPKDYLLELNEILGTNYVTTDEADAHAVAVAAARVWGARNGRFYVSDQTTKVQSALFDRDKCLGKTLAAFKKECDSDVVFCRLFAQFVRTFSP